MRIALLADLHANRDAVEACLRKLDKAGIPVVVIDYNAQDLARHLASPVIPARPSSRRTPGSQNLTPAVWIERCRTASRSRRPPG